MRLLILASIFQIGFSADPGIPHNYRTDINNPNRLLAPRSGEPDRVFDPAMYGKGASSCSQTESGPREWCYAGYERTGNSWVESECTPCKAGFFSAGGCTTWENEVAPDPYGGVVITRDGYQRWYGGWGDRKCRSCNDGLYYGTGTAETRGTALHAVKSNGEDLKDNTTLYFYNETWEMWSPKGAAGCLRKCVPGTYDAMYVDSDGNRATEEYLNTGRLLMVSLTSRTDGICKYCPKGYYQPNHGRTSCIACPKGKYMNSVGQGLGCITCPAGQETRNTWGNLGNVITTETASTTLNDCLNCFAGQYKASGQTSCKVCAAGKYSDTQSSTSCTGCPKGWYQNQLGQIDCKKCPDGKDTPGIGYPFCGCGPGQYMDSGSCMNCPAGKYGKQIAGQTSITSCTDCPKGRYNDVPGVASAGGVCKDCTVGRYSDAPGLDLCKACPAGKTISQTAISWYDEAHDISACEECLRSQTTDNTTDNGGECVYCNGTFNKTFDKQQRLTSFRNYGDSECTFCPAGYNAVERWDDGRLECKSCHNQSRIKDNDQCLLCSDHTNERLPTYDSNTQSCTTCPSSRPIWHHSLKYCTYCSDGYEPILTTSSVRPTHNYKEIKGQTVWDNSVFETYTCTRCPGGATSNGMLCQHPCQYLGNANAKTHWNESLEECTCPPERPLYHVTDKYCRTKCPDSQVWTGTSCITNSVSCPSYIPYYNGQYPNGYCTTCPSVSPYWNGQQCDTCPSWIPYYNGHSCVQCQNAFSSKPYWNTNTSTCEQCPNDRPAWIFPYCTQCAASAPYYNGYSCQLCPSNTPFWNTTTKQCEQCPESEPYWNGQECGECPESAPYWNGNTCMCSAGQSFRHGTHFFDSGTCTSECSKIEHNDGSHSSSGRCVCNPANCGNPKEVYNNKTSCGVDHCKECSLQEIVDSYKHC